MMNDTNIEIVEFLAFGRTLDGDITWSKMGP